MSKKILRAVALTFVIIMVISLFSACNPEVVDDGKLKVYLLINGNLGDKSFFDSANAGLTRIKDECPDVAVTVREIGQDASKWESALREACESKENYDLIICGTDQMREKLQRIALLFPNKNFIIFDSDINKEAKGKTFPNVYSILYKQNEGSFLAGVLAAGWLQTLQAASNNPTAGFIGGMKSDIIKDFAVGYYQGILYTNALDGMKTVKTHVDYVGGFTDSTTGKSKALAMYRSSSAPAGILYQAASQSGLGCIDAAKEDGKYIIGVDSDQYAYFAETDIAKANCIVTSVLKRVDLSLYDAIKKFMDGNLIMGTVVSLGLADVIDGQQVIGLAKNAYYIIKIPQSVRNMIDAAEAAIINGTLAVKSTYELTLTEFNALEDLVKV